MDTTHKHLKLRLKPTNALAHNWFWEIFNIKTSKRIASGYTNHDVTHAYARAQHELEHYLYHPEDYK